MNQITNVIFLPNSGVPTTLLLANALIIIQPIVCHLKSLTKNSFYVLG